MVQDVPAVNVLIAASKGVWDYDEAYLRAAIPLLRVTEAEIRECLCYCAEEDGTMVAFAALGTEARGEAMLEHLWVAPTELRRGIGAELWGYMCTVAREQGWESLRIFADPPAEGFYLRMGAVRVGQIPPRVPGGPVFPVLLKIFDR